MITLQATIATCEPPSLVRNFVKHYVEAGVDRFYVYLATDA